MYGFAPISLAEPDGQNRAIPIEVPMTRRN